jgi:hypothetical protein
MLPITVRGVAGDSREQTVWHAVIPICRRRQLRVASKAKAFVPLVTVPTTPLPPPVPTVAAPLVPPAPLPKAKSVRNHRRRIVQLTSSCVAGMSTGASFFPMRSFYENCFLINAA